METDPPRARTSHFLRLYALRGAFFKFWDNFGRDGPLPLLVKSAQPLDDIRPLLRVVQRVHVRDSSPQELFARGLAKDARTQANSAAVLGPDGFVGTLRVAAAISQKVIPFSMIPHIHKQDGSG
ncbi:MAG: hypothetical protein PVJ86_07175 [Phycisphaerales bacterium]